MLSTLCSMHDIESGILQDHSDLIFPPRPGPSPVTYPRKILKRLGPLKLNIRKSRYPENEVVGEQATVFNSNKDGKARGKHLFFG